MSLFHKLELKRDIATKYAWCLVGTWYSWGGDDPSGFDCSGSVIEVLKSIGLLPRKFDCTAQDLFIRFQKYLVANPCEGCLVFWHDGNGNINHVEYCIDEYHSIGASGGGKWVKTKEDAIKANAFIKPRPIQRDKPLKSFINPFRIINDG